MTTILQINSAARSQGAQSTLLADEVSTKLQQAHPGAKLVVRNLLSDNIPHLDDATLGAFFTPADQRTGPAQLGQHHVEEMLAAEARLDRHQQQHVHLGQQVRVRFDRGARVDREPGPGEHPRLPGQRHNAAGGGWGDGRDDFDRAGDDLVSAGGAASGVS